MTQFEGRGGGQLGADPFVEWDAAYVLGALDAEERRRYEAHLSDCPRCREAVAELSGMPALLALLDRDQVAAIDEASPEPEVPPLRPEVLDSLLAKVSWRRRRRQTVSWTMAAFAAVAAVIAVLVGIQPGSSVRPAPPASAAGMTMNRVTPNSIDATVSLISEGSGTRIEMTCTYPKEAENSAENDDDDDQLALVVVGRDGSHSRLMTWTAPSGTTTHPHGSTPMRMDQIAAVQVVTADNGDVLLQRKM